MTRGWFLLVWVNCPPIFKGMIGLTCSFISILFLECCLQWVIATLSCGYSFSARLCYHCMCEMYKSGANHV